MAKALKCDRCGQFYDLSKSLRKYQIHDMDEKNFNKTVDLCPDCYEKLCDFLNGAWKSIGMKPKEVVGTGELYPGEFESRHYEFEDCDNIKGERVIKCKEKKMITNGQLFNKFKEDYPDLEVEDYCPMHLDFVRNRIGITVWLKNGDILLYFPKISFNEACEMERKRGK